MFSQKELDIEEHQLREQIRALSPEQRARYDALEIPRLRLASTYLRLHVLLPLGIHHLYLQRWGRAALSVALSTAALLSAIGLNPWGGDRDLLVALMLLLAMIILEVPQLMNARLLVQSRNNRIMARCLTQCRSAHERQ